MTHPEPSEAGPGLPEPPVRANAAPALDPYTAMTPRFGRLAGAFGRRFFSEFRFEAGDVERLRAIEARGAVVYVMRYSSRLDYFLFNWLFLSAGLRLSAFANAIRFDYYRPFREALQLLLRGLALRLRLGPRGERERGIGITRRVLRERGSLFLFLRTDKIGTRIRPRKGAVATGRSELDYLREVVDACFAEPLTVSLVPLALFWRKGSRPPRPFLNLFYGGPERPTDSGKVLSFLWNYRNLAVRVGTPIDLRAFVDERRAEGLERVVKQVRRSLLVFLRREEKPVIGAPLRPLHLVEEAVFANPELRSTIAEVAASQRRPERKVAARARLVLREIAARPSPVALAVLDVIVGALFRRLFARFEVHGIERVIEAAKLHPLVMLPAHRSYFDFLILSWLFYEHHLVPPHVAAGINLSFWPLGSIFRRGGAFFLRRSYEGDVLYRAVFRTYVQLLIKDGATQEFFIEGTRSRTGKTLPPRLGMLGMVLEAFARGVRRDLYLVPVGFTYERLVEERSMTEERSGGRKSRESLLGLLRARRVLRHRFGSVTVRFGEPISVAERVGARGPSREELRPLIEPLGEEICRRINALVTAGRSAVSAAALLGGPGHAVRMEEFARRVQETVAILELQGVPLSAGLRACLAAERPEAALELLVQGRLVRREPGLHTELVREEEGVRGALDYYRAGIAPALAWPGVLALALRQPGERASVVDGAAAWLDLLRLEYFPVEGPERERRLGRLLEHFLSRGWVREGAGGLERTEAGAPWLEFFADQIRPALETYRAVLQRVRDLATPATRAEILVGARRLLREQGLLGEAAFPEADCPVAMGNALVRLLREGWLRAHGSPHRAETRFQRIPGTEARVDDLLERVAGALEGG